MKFRGAEAEVEINNEVIKTRKPKKYRHPDLDKRLRTERTKSEAHLLKEADRAGVNVPKILETSKDTIQIEKVDGQQLKEVVESKPELAEALGKNIALLHEVDIIHGDLTTSNAIAGEKLHIIDFGLAYRSQRVEDKAVDLHLFKQVLNSSHPDVAEESWQSFLDGYRDYEKFDAVMERLEDVEKRGRYK